MGSDILAKLHYERACEYIQKANKAGMDFMVKRNEERAVTCLRMAYEDGNAEAAYRLAAYYSQGSFRNNEFSVYASGDNAKKSLEWMKKSAELGYIKACDTLAHYYYDAPVGSLKAEHQDKEEALKWFRKADELGLDNAWTYMVDILSDKNKFSSKAYQKELMEVLLRHIPASKEALRTWKYADMLYTAHVECGQEIKTHQIFDPFFEAKNRAIMYRYSSIIPDGQYVVQELTMPPVQKDDYSYLMESRKQYVSLVGDTITYEEAFHWYEKHKDGESWDLWALGNYALCYYKGIYVKQDYSKAVELLLKLVEEAKYILAPQEPEFYVALADCYYAGRGVQQDYTKAREMYEKTAYLNDCKNELSRTSQLAYCYQMEKKYTEAIRLYELSAKHCDDKDPWAMGNLGGMYYNGYGTAVDYDKAYKLLRKAADAGNVYSINFVGICYHSGHGVPQNYAEAVKWYKKAAESGYSASMSNLGYCYRYGLGVDKDLYTALDYYKQALKAGYKTDTTKQIISDIEDEIINSKISSAATTDKTNSSASKNVNATVKTEAKVTTDNNNNNSVSQVSTAREELDSLIGLEEVKKEISFLENTIIANAKRRALGLPATEVSKNMVFTGNPGTGKTTVARIVAQIFKENGLLSKGQLIETDRGGLVDQYIGGTAKKTTEKFNEALGGVLFIDEAYALAPEDSSRDFGPEAIAALIKLMEDHKNELVVIVAGYENEMRHFIDSNPGLKSRFTTYINFPDYTPDELQQIFDRIITKDKYILTEDARKKLVKLWNESTNYENLGNGRAVRNVYEKIKRLQDTRIINNNLESKLDLMTITAEDIPAAEAVFQ